MSALEDAFDNARATRSRIDDRLAVARLGRSLTREMDADMLTLKEAGAALDALIAEHERLTAPPTDDEHGPAHDGCACQNRRPDCGCFLWDQDCPDYVPLTKDAS